MSDKVIKKEFVTYWSIEDVTLNKTDILSMFSRQFFDRQRAVLPAIAYKDLLVFANKKTKITIEVVP